MKPRDKAGADHHKSPNLANKQLLLQGQAVGPLKERKTMNVPEVRSFVNSLRSTFSFLEALQIPTIAVIEVGHVLADVGPTQDDVNKRQNGVIGRSVLLRPGSPLATEFGRHPIVLKIDDWVLCHGGLLPHHGSGVAVTYGIEKINNEVSKWMNNVGENDELQIPFIATRGYDSIVWNCLYYRDTTDLEDYHIEQIHSVLESTLQVVGAKAMVVGYTPETAGVNW
ncbi:hypothetical protein L2E82_05116 [Cichorium intybus]|uniref:Uncharacterized protein n=1 Tax=Cichorium intybus TaxID=13427 RepID=A0ACB9H7P8_CICIN|nr:hypothetical protein L2E82_05116 [Cichorium intybus]